MKALGLIETVGYTTAVSAADAAVKAADVEIIGMEKVIGVSGYVGVTIHLTGDVAAVKAAVDAGKSKGEAIGKIISAEVIARAHSDVHEALLSKFLISNEAEQTEEVPTKIAKAENVQTKAEVKKDTVKKETVKKPKAASSPKKQSRKKDDGKEA